MLFDFFASLDLIEWVVIVVLYFLLFG